jgi:dienelactone hydrolase
MSAPAQIDGFTLRRPETDDVWTWPVYRRGTGPPVIVMHELDGLTDETIKVATRIADAKFSVWVPALVGPAPSKGFVDTVRTRIAICMSHEINVFVTGRTSRIVTPLRALAATAARASGTTGAGVVGMCLTGGFALALVADENVLAAVSAEPALPLAWPVTPWCAKDLGMSAIDVTAARARLEAGAVEVYLTRFTRDRLSPSARQDAVVARLGPKGVTVDALPSEPGNPYRFRTKDHAVLTEAPKHYAEVHVPEAIDRLEKTAERVIEFLERRLRAG